MEIVTRHTAVISLWSVILVGGCNLLGATYAAEVGHYEGEQLKWEVWGDFASLDKCRTAAIARFNQYNVQSSGRATSWSCLKKNSDGGYESRHR